MHTFRSEQSLAVRQHLFHAVDTRRYLPGMCAALGEVGACHEGVGVVRAVDAFEVRDQLLMDGDRAGAVARRHAPPGGVAPQFEDVTMVGTEMVDSGGEYAFEVLGGTTRVAAVALVGAHGDEDLVYTGFLQLSAIMLA